MGALLSPCGTYRYRLTRPGELTSCKTTALFVMLNPSTADAALDDPTIRRCRRFARDWGCAGIAVGNLYGLRSTDPKALWGHADPVGPDNDLWLASMAREMTDVVCAWGVNAKPERVAAVRDLLARSRARLWCLGTTKDGHPRHPLYVKADQPLVEYSA